MRAALPFMSDPTTDDQTTQAAPEQEAPVLPPDAEAQGEKKDEEAQA